MPSWRRNNREVVIKGFVIAGTGSGSGKTTLSLAVMAYLEHKGFKVAPFKVGPDFIDPGHHRALTGRNSRNLDSWMLSKEYNQGVFAHGCLPHGADMAVVEGVMGLFDGYSGVDEAGSTAQMAKWLGLPVILVVDARSMARSVAAIVQGFENFDPDLNFAGVIFSKTGSPRHYDYLKEAVEANCKMPCLGHMPRNGKIALPERHLGLVTSDEHGIAPDVVSELVSMVDRYTDIGTLAGTLPDLELPPWKVEDTTVEASCEKGVRIAVARDRAFCFYYPENLEALEAAGAEIVRFSPLTDRALPENVHGIYFGGGYPELFAKQLSDNQGLIREIREKSADAMPIYGECGGFMYLCSSLTGMDSGEAFEMTGCFPFSVSMSKRLRSLGYREIALAEDTLVGKKGERLRGHEFHYSSLDDATLVPGKVKTVYAVSLRDGTRTATAGYQVENTLGSYMHIHFGSLAAAAGRFVDQCRRFRDRGGRP